MNELNELQNLWQSGSNEITDFTGPQVPGKLIQKLKKLESLQDRVNKIKLLVIALVLFYFGFIFYHFHITSIAAYIGMGIIFLGVILFMLKYLKNQFNIKRLDFTATSIDFADNAIHMLEKQNSIFKLPFLIFSILLIMGSNIILYGLNAFKGQNLMLPILYNVFIIIATCIGYQIRMWRIKKEVLPIIRDLNELKENLIQKTDNNL